MYPSNTDPVTTPLSRRRFLRQSAAVTALTFGSVSLTGCLDEKPDWPPRLGQAFPDLELIDHTGREFRLSELKGKVILMEPIGMNCAACNAYSGGQQVGGFNGMAPQEGIQSIETYLPMFADGLDMSHPDVRLVQLILYDYAMGQPNAEDARFWAEHFGLDQSDNILVVVPKADMRGKASFRMIPGFQLVDQEFVLRRDAAGHKRRHDLYRELLPMVSELVWG